MLNTKDVPIMAIYYRNLHGFSSFWFTLIYPLNRQTFSFRVNLQTRQ